MTSRERLRTTMNHKQPDRIPLDLGATSVTGLHVSVVAALREHYGLVKQPVKVHEPYQMLGWVDEDLKQAIGVDVEGAIGPKTLFGFAHGAWKEWRAPWGQEMLVPGGFNTTVDPDGT